MCAYKPTKCAFCVCVLTVLCGKAECAGRVQKFLKVTRVDAATTLVTLKRGDPNEGKKNFYYPTNNALLISAD